jgi:hypothetical protein
MTGGASRGALVVGHTDKARRVQFAGFHLFLGAQPCGYYVPHRLARRNVRLVTKIAESSNGKASQAQVAELLWLSQPNLSKPPRGRFRSDVYSSKSSSGHSSDQPRSKGARAERLAPARGGEPPLALCGLFRFLASVM